MSKTHRWPQCFCCQPWLQSSYKRPSYMQPAGGGFWGSIDPPPSTLHASGPVQDPEILAGEQQISTGGLCSFCQGFFLFHWVLKRI